MEDKLRLETGIKGRQEVVVSDANSAKTMGSGTLDVFATPAMTALMEKTAWMSVADQLDEGCGTVGTLLNVTHDAPTPLGMTVWCETELVEVDGRRLVFDVAAYDAKGKIGGGRHERSLSKTRSFRRKRIRRLSSNFSSARPKYVIHFYHPLEFPAWVVFLIPQFPHFAWNFEYFPTLSGTISYIFMETL